MEGLRNIYRAALLTAALGAVTLTGGCRTLGYEWKRDDKGLYLSKIEVVADERPEVTESVVEADQLEPTPADTLRQRANEYRSKIVEQIDSYRSGNQTAGELSENIRRIEAEYIDVGQEVERRLQESEAKSEDHEEPAQEPNSEQTYKTLEDLRREYGLNHPASEFDEVGFLRYVDDEKFAGRTTDDVYSEAERYVQSLKQPEPSQIRESNSDKPHWFVNYVLDLPNGVLKLFDLTLGQSRRLWHDDHSRFSEAYESQPAELRFMEAIAAWKKAEEVGVNNNFIGSGDGPFGSKDGHNRRKHDLVKPPEPQPPLGLFEDAPNPETPGDTTPFFGGGQPK